MNSFRPSRFRRFATRVGSIACTALIVSAAAPARAEDWPRFRGPTGQGISSETGLPTKWSLTENVAWKTPISGEGWSSPIVSGGKVFVTSATDGGASCHVMCLDAGSGKIIWDKEVFKQKLNRKEGKNSYATPTPVTDGKNVYAFFAGGGAAAVSFDGKLLWTNQDNEFYSQHGLGASPVLHKNLLIMPFDMSSPGEDKTVGWKKPWDGAYVLALDTMTGKQRWKAKRGPSRLAHVTPQIAEVGGKPQLISGAGDAIQGFDPETGQLIWTVFSQGEGVTPSLVIGDGLAYTSSGFEADTIRVVRLDPAARGDVTKTHIAWEVKKAVPTMPSFLLHDGLLLSVKENGIAQCLDARTGKEVWTHRLEAGGNYSASPVYADGKIYILSEAGVTTVLQAGKEYKVLAENELEGHCQASPAVSGGRIFIRTDKNLYCITAAGKTAG